MRIYRKDLTQPFQNIISNIIRIADSKLLEKDMHLSENIYYWPLYLLYGLHNRLQLDLLELGFSNRIAIIALSKRIQQINYKYDELKQLKKYIKQNSDQLLEKISSTIPQISLEKMRENIEYL